MRRHTVYLRTETVVFSLASDAVNDEGKTTMTAGLLGASEGEIVVIDTGLILRSAGRRLMVDVELRGYGLERACGRERRQAHWRWMPATSATVASSDP